MKDLEAFKKLDEAVRALKEAGYEFSAIDIADTDFTTLRAAFSRRAVEMRCYKNFPVSENGEMMKLRKLKSFGGTSIC